MPVTDCCIGTAEFRQILLAHNCLTVPFPEVSCAISGVAKIHRGTCSQGLFDRERYFDHTGKAAAL